MSSISVQQWEVAYLVIALLLAMATVLAAPHVRVGEPPSVLADVAVATLAGALWPLILIGLAQLWVVRATVTRFGSGRRGTGRDERAVKALVSAH